MVHKVLKVKGMSCGHCQARIEKTLKELEGVSQVEVNLEKGEVEVNYDENMVTLETLQEAIEDAGYDVVG